MSEIDGAQTVGALAIGHDGGREKIEEGCEEQGDQKDAHQGFGDGDPSPLFSVWSHPTRITRRNRLMGIPWANFSAL